MNRTELVEKIATVIFEEIDVDPVSQQELEQLALRITLMVESARLDRAMTSEQAEALRKPFDRDQIGLLPKPTKRDNQKGHCNECGKFHGLPAVHLDYVGHAAVTDRLLKVDPEWTWEPMGTDEEGQPYVETKQNGSMVMWIKMTVAGVTRPGVGTVEPGKTEPEKQLISDAIRNAAQRFGVAIDLWSKEDLNLEDGDSQAPTSLPAVTAQDMGWEDADQHKAMWESLWERVKQQPDAIKEEVRKMRAELGKEVQNGYAPRSAFDRIKGYLDSQTKARKSREQPDSAQEPPEDLEGDNPPPTENEAVERATEAFPGSNVEDHKGCSNDELQVVTSYLEAIKDDTASMRAWKKYSKEKGYPSDTNLFMMTSEQARQAADFLETV